jgi:hypothetical protein
MTPEQVTDRAEQAKRLLENKLLTDAFAAIEAKWIAALFNSQYGDSTTREHCYRNVAAVREVRAQLAQYVNDGKIAEIELEAKGKR